MGGDGGVIATNRKYMREAKLSGVKEKEDANDAAQRRASNCAVSQLPLGGRVVACELGSLYNKGEILERLLSKTLDPAFAHVRRLGDLLELDLTPNPSFGKDATAAPWMCPVTGLDMNGKHAFVALRPSGKVYAAKALQNVPSLAEGEAVVALLPEGRALEEARAALAAARAAEKAKRKRRKRERAAAGGVSSATDDRTKRKQSKQSVGGAAVKAVAHKSISKPKGSVYASLFNTGEDKDLSEADRKKKLLMGGNTRGTVRC